MIVRSREYPCRVQDTEPGRETSPLPSRQSVGNTKLSKSLTSIGTAFFIAISVSNPVFPFQILLKP